MPGNVPPVEGERANLLAYLEQQRYGIRLTAFGLTDAQARATPTSSALSVGGLIKHVTAMERNWMDIILQRDRAGTDPAEYGDDFVMRPDETLADIWADNERCGHETEAIVAAIADLGQAVPVPKGVPWFPDDVEAWSVRWVLLHVIEEVARHAGHADIVREHIDGGTMYPIMAAAEKWPESPWMQPWKPTGDQVMP
jgi:uncharacterized damage-inducible protein DinB